MQRALNGPLSLRFLSYRDYSPLPHAQVDDAPFGGGAGMLMRVDAVASAWRAPTAATLESVRAERRIVALDPGRTPRSTTPTRASSPACDRTSRCCAAATRASTRACWSTSPPIAQPRPVRAQRRRAGGDGRRRRARAPAAGLAGATTASSEEESFAPALDGRARVPALHAARRVARAAPCRRCCSRATTARIDAWRREQAVARAAPTAAGADARLIAAIV